MRWLPMAGATLLDTGRTMGALPLNSSQCSALAGGYGQPVLHVGIGLQTIEA